MSVLSDKEILRRRETGQVVIEPFIEKNVRGSSVDLTLGNWFYRCDVKQGGIYNPFDAEDIDRYFAGPFQMKPYSTVYKKIAPRTLNSLVTAIFNRDESQADFVKIDEGGWPSPVEGESPFPGIPPDWPLLILRPHERILAHTHEFAGTQPPGTTEMRARSSWGRNGIDVCSGSSGWGDPGFINRWTMEITNLNDESVVLPWGERICQLIFHEMTESRESYGTETLYESKYQATSSVREAIETWEPKLMLPRSWKDERVEPLSIEGLREGL